MRFLSIPITLTCLLAAVAAAQQDDNALTPLQGTWKLIAYEALGKKSSAQDLEEVALALRVQGDRYADFSAGKVVEEGKIKLAADKKPAQIDIFIEKGADAGKKQLGIYKVEGDTLTFAIAPAGSKDRPASFTTKLESRFNVQIFKRAKK